MDDLKCFFDVSINGRDCGRIIFKLFVDKCPKTCENFRCLCTGEKGRSEQSGRLLHYKGSKFHRIVKNFIIQGGDITDGNGKGGDSIYGGAFDDENLELAHDEPYLLSMANRGPNTNKSQFFITTNEAAHLDRKHVVFGRVVAGLDTILKIERQEVDSKSRPLKDVIIANCGQVNPDDGAEIKRISHQVPSTKKAQKRELSRSPVRIRRSSRNKSSESSFSHSSSCSSGSSSSVHSSTSSRLSHGSAISPAYRSRARRRSSSCSSSDERSSHSCSTGSSDGSSTSSSSVTGARDSSSESRDSRSSGRDSRNSYDYARRKRRRQTSSSSSDFSDDSFRGRHRKRARTNRRLESSRNRDTRDSDKRVSAGKRDRDVARQEEDEEEKDTYVNPSYKCSVNLDEIPQVPLNRFLMRVPATSKRRTDSSRRQDDEKQDEASEIPIEVDLSKFEDIPEDKEDENISSSQAAALRSQRKATTDPLVSKSGRIMKGRGTFKFRTPSPNDRKRYDHYEHHRSKHSSSRWPTRDHQSRYRHR